MLSRSLRTAAARVSVRASSAAVTRALSGAPAHKDDHHHDHHHAEPSEPRLFGEPEPEEGKGRERQSWELPWALFMGGGFVLTTYVLSTKKDTSLNTWANDQAKKTYPAPAAVAAPLKDE
jgi:hypothetical protein